MTTVLRSLPGSHQPQYFHKAFQSHAEERLISLLLWRLHLPTEKRRPFFQAFSVNCPLQDSRHIFNCRCWVGITSSLAQVQERVRSSADRPLHAGLSLNSYCRADLEPSGSAPPNLGQLCTSFAEKHCSSREERSKNGSLASSPIENP